MAGPVKKTVDYISGFKIHDFFPFYIENVNDKFFSGAQAVQNKSFFQSKQKAIIAQLNTNKKVQLTSQEDLLSEENIQYLLNQIVLKIVALTGNQSYDFFVDQQANKEPVQGLRQSNLFVKIKNVLEDLKTPQIGNDAKRYLYTLQIDPKSYLHSLVTEIQIFFYTDVKNKQITGGFTLDFSLGKKQNDFNRIVQNYYLNALLINFFNNQLTPFSLNNFLSILDLYSLADFSYLQKKQQVIAPKIANRKPFEALLKEWKNYIGNKIPPNEDQTFYLSQKYLENDCFFAFLNVIVVCLIIYEELKKYFQNDQPELFLPLLRQIEYTKTINNKSSQKDLFELINLAKQRYFSFEKNYGDLKKIKDPSDALASLIKFDRLENESFGPFSISYELIRNTKKGFFAQDDDLFLNAKELKFIFLLVFNSAALGIKLHSLDFLDYASFIANMEQFVWEESWQQFLETKSNEYLCEHNYNYISLLDKQFNILIIKNNYTSDNLQDQEHLEQVYVNYVWALIYSQTLIWKLNDWEQTLEINKDQKPWLLRKQLYQMESLYLDWYDDFLGILQVKNIVKKIDDFYHFNNLNLILKKKIARYDRAYGKSKERKNLIIAFFSASVFGLMDFFTMVYSVLTVDNPKAGLSQGNIAIIAIGTLFILVLVVVFVYIIFNLYKGKIKKEELPF